MTKKDGIKRGLIALFFVAFLAVGCAIYSDFGVHWDETHNQMFGEYWGRYVASTLTGHGPRVQELPERSSLGRHTVLHGPFWELILYFSAGILYPGGGDPSRIILFRHLMNFILFFVATLVFFLVCRRLFAHDGLAMLGTMMLILHPRIFADAFYNTVDLAFLSFYIIAIWTWLRLLKEITPANAAWHALACAVLVDVRIIGGIIPFATMVALAWKTICLRRRGEKTGPVVLPTVLFLALFAVGMVLFWPYLWKDPIGRFLLSFDQTRFSASKATLHLSNPEAISFPFYNFKWIGVTTPWLCLFLFGAGIAALLVPTRFNVYRDAGERKQLAALSTLIFVPLLLPVILKTLLFDGWRHHYFIYPVMVLIAVCGAGALFKLAATRLPRKWRKAVTGALILVVLASLASTALIIARLHPHQFIYANGLAGKNLERARRTGALDYWVLSGRTALEHLLASDPQKTFFLYMPIGKNNLQILPPEMRKRLVFTDSPRRAEYFVTVFYQGRGPAILYQNPLVYSKSYKGVKYLGIFALPGKSRNAPVAGFK
jgi:hypothetical protein